MRIAGLEVDLPFIEDLGIELVEFCDGHVVARLDSLPRHCNARGAIHGGALMSLLDFVMAVSARRVLPDGTPDAHGNVTIEMKTSFLRPATGRVTAIGRRVQGGATLNFCEGELRDAQDRIVARASGTFMRHRPDAGSVAAG
ncbi:MAG: PaaI family thioesterase [Lautropia sp.]